MGPGSFTIAPAMRVLTADLGVPWSRLMRRAGLPDGLLDEGAVRVPAPRYYAFWSVLEEELSPRDVALEVGRSITMETLDAPLMAALCSPDLRTAVHRAAAYKPLVGSVDLHVTRSERGLELTHSWPLGPRPPASLLVSDMVMWVALARRGTRHPVRPVQVTVPAVTERSEELEEYLGVRLTRDGAPSIVFSSDDARRPFLTENHAVWYLLAPTLDRSLADAVADLTVVDHVRRVLRRTLPGGEASIGSVSRAMAVSPRTLQRRLREEGTTFQDVLATTREGLATHHLALGDRSPTEIAALLGYGDVTSFRRAFRSWTGRTPEEARDPR